MSDRVNSKFGRPISGDISPRRDIAAGERSEEKIQGNSGDKGGRTHIDWAAKLQRFQQITKPLRSASLVPSMWDPIISRAATSGKGDVEKPADWIFSDPVRGLAFLEAKIKSGEWDLEYKKMSDYLKVLGEGISSKGFEGADDWREGLIAIEGMFKDFGDRSEYHKLAFEGAYRMMGYEALEKLRTEYEPLRKVVFGDPGIDEFIYTLGKIVGADLSDEVKFEDRPRNFYPGVSFNQFKLDVVEYLNHRIKVDLVGRVMQDLLELLLEAAMDLLGVITPVSVQVMDKFRGVPYHMIVDELREPNSYSARTIEQVLNVGTMPALEMRIRDGAMLDEVFHEVIHSIPQDDLPQSLKVKVTLPKVDPDDDFVIFKNALELSNNAREASAFTGMSVLRRQMHEAGMGKYPVQKYYSPELDEERAVDFLPERLISFADEGGADRVYEEIASHMPAYRKQGVGSAWKIAAAIKGRRLPRGAWSSHVWAQDAEGWGVFSKRPWEGEGSYRVTSVNVDVLLESILEIDPTRALRLLEMMDEDGGVMMGDIYTPSPRMFRPSDEIGPRPTRPPHGDADRPSRDKESSIHRVNLLGVQAHLWPSLPIEDVARLEALLLKAEHSEGEEASKLYGEAESLMLAQAGLRLYGSAAIMMARIGASMVESGYGDLGRRHLKNAAHYFLRSDEILTADDEKDQELDFDMLISEADLVALDSRPQLLEWHLDSYIKAGLSSEILSMISPVIKSLFTEHKFDEEGYYRSPELMEQVSSYMRILARLVRGGGLKSHEDAPARELLNETFQRIMKYAPQHIDPTDSAIAEIYPGLLVDYFRDLASAKNDAWRYTYQRLVELLHYQGELPLELIAAIVSAYGGTSVDAAGVKERGKYVSEEWMFRTYKGRYPLGLKEYLEDRFEGRRRGVRGRAMEATTEQATHVGSLLHALLFLERPERKLRLLARRIVEGLPPGSPKDHFYISRLKARDAFNSIIAPGFSSLGALGRMSVLAGGGRATDVFFSYMDARALALIRLARAFPDKAREYLEEAEKSTVTDPDYDGEEDVVFEPRVRLENYKEVLTKINVLSQLRDAYVEVLDDIESAERIHDVIMMDYAEDLANSLKKQRDAVREFYASHPDHAEESASTLPISEEDLQKSPARFSPLAIDLRFDVLKARHYARADDLDEARALLRASIERVREDVEQRRGHYQIAHILNAISAISKEDGLSDYAIEFARIAINASALLRGASDTAYTSGEGLRGGDNPLLLGYEVGSGQESWIESLAKMKAKQLKTIRQGKLFVETDEEMIFQSNRFFMTDAHFALSELASRPQPGLVSFVADFIDVVEDSVLTKGQRETLYIEFVDAMIPSRAANWPEVIERAHVRLKPFEDIIEDGRYPNLERHILGKLAHTAKQVRFDPDKPLQNAGVVSALTGLSRGILERHPELVRPENVERLISISQDHEYLLSLKRLFPHRIESALATADTARVGGVEYSLGDVLVGRYDRSKLVRQIQGALESNFKKGVDVRSDESVTLIRMAKEVLHGEFKKFVTGWIETSVVGELPAEDVRFVARFLLSPRDYEEAVGLSDYAVDVIERSAGGERVFDELEVLAMEILNATGAASDYAFNTFVTDVNSWEQADKRRYFSLILKAASFKDRNIGAPSDLIWSLITKRDVASEFLGSLMVEPDEVDVEPEGLFETYGRFADWLEGKGELNGSLLRPMDILLYYDLAHGEKKRSEENGARKSSRDYIPFDDFVEMIRDRSQLRHSISRHGSRWRKMMENFASPAQAGLMTGVRNTEFQNGLIRLTDEFRGAKEEISLASFRVPKVFRDMSPAVRYAVIRYFTNLPLGEREDILKDFEGRELSEERAFELFFEKTGNEKLAQFLSLLKGVVPERHRRCFEKFRDRVKGSFRKEIELELNIAYGQRPQDIFSDFDYEMIKSGTIGEIYKATIKAGTKLATSEGKSLNIDEDMPVMLKILTGARQEKMEKNFVRLMEVAKDVMRVATRFGLRFDPVDIVNEFIRTMREEMDFGLEIENAKEYARLLPSGVVTPVYYPDISRPNILVMSQLEGVAFDDVADVGVKRRVADRLGTMLARHILIDGLFHDDLHPKNVFVDGEVIGLIDFGRLGRLNHDDRAALINFMMDLYVGDVDKIVEDTLSLTRKSAKWASRKSLEDGIAKLLKGAKMEEMVGVADEVFTVAAASGYTISRRYMQAMKALVTLESTVREDERLANFNMASHIKDAMPDAVMKIMEEANGKGGGGFGGGKGSPPAPKTPPASPPPTTPSSPVTPPARMSPSVSVSNAVTNSVSNAVTRSSCNFAGIRLPRVSNNVIGGRLFVYPARPVMRM